MSFYCPNCFYSGYDGKQCQICGYHLPETISSRPVLYPNIQLKNRYWIGRLLGAGGFGVTYLAYDNNAHRKCAIKEFFPREFSIREKGDVYVTASDVSTEGDYQHGLDMFLKEAKNLYSLENNSNVVSILDYFRENGTAYLVMELLEGYTLKEIMNRNKEKRLPAEQAIVVLLSTVETLEYVHKQKIIHRDISPENIFWTSKNEIKLIDFGAARGYLERRKGEGGGYSIMLKPGFAPIEQYAFDGNQGTWTDVYALAATYYYLVSGEKVPDALNRLYGDKKLIPLSEKCPQISKELSDVIDHALACKYENRIQNMNEFRLRLYRVLRPQTIYTQTPKKKVSAYVTRILGNGKRIRWELPHNQRITMGRSEYGCCDIVVDHLDTNISRNHCYITYIPEKQCFRLCDDSKNGTYLEQGRLIKGQNVMLHQGTVFYLASPNYKFILEVEVK